MILSVLDKNIETDCGVTIKQLSTKHIKTGLNFVHKQF